MSGDNDMADIRNINKNGREVLIVGGALTVKHAKALRAALLEAVRNAPAIEVDVENVDDVDISFAQLLCSAHRMAADMNKQMTITGLEQERFIQLLGRLGLLRHIGCNDSTRKSCLWLYGQKTL
jgi:anti-anti-sigma regulatory factor